MNPLLVRASFRHVRCIRVEKMNDFCLDFTPQISSINSTHFSAFPRQFSRHSLARFSIKYFFHSNIKLCSKKKIKFVRVIEKNWKVIYNKKCLHEKRGKLRNDTIFYLNIQGFHNFSNFICFEFHFMITYLKKHWGLSWNYLIAFPSDTKRVPFYQMKCPAVKSVFIKNWEK